MDGKPLVNQGCNETTVVVNSQTDQRTIAPRDPRRTKGSLNDLLGYQKEAEKT